MNTHSRPLSLPLIARTTLAGTHLTGTFAALLVSGCCMSAASAPAASAPAASAPTTPAVAAPTGTPAGAPAGGPGTPGCPDLTTSIVGTWSTQGLVEEYRADGAYVINGVAGTYRFTTPGHAVLDEPSSGLHAEFDLGLSDASTLIAIGPNHVAMIYTRTSPPPAIATHCFDVAGAFARTWTPRGGGAPEVYAADGTYTVGGSGRWSFTAPGRLLLTRTDGVTSDYVVAMPSPTVMLAVRAGQGVAYDG